jgi:hypothetical protein
VSPGEVASIAFGALGVGGAVVSLYIRSTIAETIIMRLNGRYVATTFCGERHANLMAQLTQMQNQMEKFDQKMETGFDSLRSQLIGVQESGRRVEHDQILREQTVPDRLRNQIG